MNEHEEFEDLPPIEVACLGRGAFEASDADSFEMPDADELASQRERELECEQELRALPAPVLARCDSSGSDGEAALTAAVRALAMSPAHPAPPADAAPAQHELCARTLLAALLPHLPPAVFLEEYLYATTHLDDDTLAALTDDMMCHVAALVSCEQNVWSESEAVALGAWLCVVGVARQTRGARRAAVRALRALPAEAHAGALGAALAHAPPAALLPLADALGGAAHSRLAADLCDTALAHYLLVQKEQISRSSCEEVAALVCARRAALHHDARYALVQLVGRRLAAAAAATPASPGTSPATAHAHERLLRALERAPAPAHRHRAEQLKVSVGVSKLLSLFGSQLDSDQAQGKRNTT